MIAWLLGYVTAFLVWLSADPHAIALEDARAAAAVAAARVAVLDANPRRDDEAVPPAPEAEKPKPVPAVVPPCHDGSCKVR